MLIKNLDYGGAFKMFLWVAKILTERGYDICLVTYLPNAYTDVPDNVKIKALDLSNKCFIRKVIEIRNIIKSEAPDICISFLLDANIYCILGCIGLKTQSIVCERNDPFKPHYYKLKLLKPLFSWADGAVFQLERARDYYNNIAVPTAIIPNPVRGNKIKVSCPFQERQLVISTLGRIDIFQKRQDVLIKAFASFHQKHPEYLLKIWGDGSEKDESIVKNLIKELKLHDCVVLAGVTDKPSEVIADTRFFVLSSDFEGIPNALIEAMSVGLPCISTDCSPGGAALLVESGTSGILTPCNDWVKLAEKMCWMAEHPKEADIMGTNALKISERFSDEKIANMWINYIERIKQR